MSQPTPQQYNQAYQSLRNSVEKLRQTDISDIDELVPLVEQATAAYGVCKQRLEAVEKLVRATLVRATDEE